MCIMTFFLVKTRMFLVMSKMLAQCGLFLSRWRGYRRSGSGCLAFRRLKSLRSYQDHHRRVLACSPKCRYDLTLVVVRWQYPTLFFVIHILHSQPFLYPCFIDKADDGSSHKANRREEETTEYYVCIPSKKMLFFTLTLQRKIGHSLDII